MDVIINRNFIDILMCAPKIYPCAPLKPYTNVEQSSA